MSIGHMIAMKWFIYCRNCKNEICVNGMTLLTTETIPLKCAKCNESHTYNRTDRVTRVSRSYTSRYAIYKNKLYSDKRITGLAIAAVVVSLVLSGLNILHQPLEILASVFLAFLTFMLGSGRVKIEYSDERAIRSIRVRHF